MRSLRVLACVLLLSGCSGSPSAPVASGPSSSAPTARPPTPTPAPIPGSPTAGGCGQTPVYLGTMPDWTARAGVPAPSRYVVSHEGNLVGVLFGDKLRSPAAASGPNNKILWIAREPREGSSLKVTLTAAAGGAPSTMSFPANSSPGEIYPSIVDAPGVGCWTVVAEWNGNRATLELPYVKG